MLDLVRDKLTLTQKTDELFRIKRKYSPITVFYEKNGAAIDVPHIEQMMEEYHNHFDIVRLVQSKDKGMRMEALLPLFEAHRIWFPEGGCVHRNWEGRDEDMLHSFIVEELLAYPHITHDDGLDDLSNILHPTCMAYMRRPDRESMEEQVYNALRGKGLTLEPLYQQEEYDPFEDYRTDGGRERGPWTDIYRDRGQDRTRSYGTDY